MASASRSDTSARSFALLAVGAAELMVDQIGLGRDFNTLAPAASLGAGLNLQIRVPSVAPLLTVLAEAGYPLHLGSEERWYRHAGDEIGHRQFVVADPDGYLLRFYEALGTRPAV